MEYNKTDMIKAYREYQTSSNKLNEDKKTMESLYSIYKIAYEEEYSDIKSSIVSWLEKMGSLGLIDNKDAGKVESILSNAENMLESSKIEEKINNAEAVHKGKLEEIRAIFESVHDNKGFINNVMSIKISGLTMERVDVIKEILDRNDVHVNIGYSTNSSGERGDFVTEVYSDNKDILKDISDMVNMASLKHNFKGNVKNLTILNKKDVFELLMNTRTPVMIGSKLNDIVNVADMEEKPKSILKPKM